MKYKVGYSLEMFSEAPDPMFKCSICLLVLRDPVQCKNGHMNCRTCIRRAMKRLLKCPVCRCDVNEGLLSSCLVIKEQIKELKVVCSDRGCNWIGIQSQRRSHEANECQMTRVICPYFQSAACGQMCTGVLFRKDFATHLLEASNFASGLIALLKTVDSQKTLIAKLQNDIDVFTGKSNSEIKEDGNKANPVDLTAT